MFRKTLFAIATSVAIGAAALAPNIALAKGGHGHGGHGGHGHGGHGHGGHGWHRHGWHGHGWHRHGWHVGWHGGRWHGHGGACLVRRIGPHGHVHWVNRCQ